MTDEPVAPPAPRPETGLAEPFPQAAAPAVPPSAPGAPMLERSEGAPPPAPAALAPPFPSALAGAAGAPPPGPRVLSQPGRDSAVDAPAAPPPRRRDERPRPARGPRPDLVEAAEPVFRESRGYRMRLEPADLTRLRELPGSKGKTDRELGETFFDGQSDRFTTSLAEDVPSPAEVRVVVDPYSRQAFLAVEKKIRSILSF